MPFIALDNLWHRKLTGRDWLALVFLLITLSSFASVCIAYEHSQSALRIATDSRDRLRHQRKVTEFGLCFALNQARAINNRDRTTLVRSYETTKQDIRVLPAGLVRSLLRKSLAETRHEIAIRPYLPIIDCKKLINNPKRGQLLPH